MGLRAPMDPAELLSSLQAGRVGQSDRTNLEWSYQETEVKTPRDLNSIWFEVQGKKGRHLIWRHVMGWQSQSVL